jgi:hypothetical protein
MLIFVLCMCHRLASAQSDEPDAFPREIPAADNLFPHSFSSINGALRDFDQASKQNFALELGPKLIQLKGSYFERRQNETALVAAFGEPQPSRWGRYFDLLATSSRFDGKLSGEGELAYSTLGETTAAAQQPLMSRLGLSGRWGKIGYGLSRRSAGRGFVSPTGEKTEHDRDENQIYTEYDFGVFRIRGAAGEALEKNFDTHELTLTRTAATSLYWNRPGWSAIFSSSYSLVGQSEQPGPKTPAFVNGVALVYRPVAPLSVEPSLNFKQEWDAVTRLKTETPSAAFALAYIPMRELQLRGRASYARDLSEDPLKNGSLVNTAAALNWRIGKSLFGEQSLSLQFEYKNESRFALPENSHSNVTGSIQFKINGF